MKKYLLLIALSFAMVETVQAQEVVSSSTLNKGRSSGTLSNFQFSPVVGLQSTSYAGIKGLNGAEFADRQYFTGGISAVYGKGYWQFETGLIHSTIGTSISLDYLVNGLNVVATQESSSSYLNVPLMARWTFFGNQRTRLFLRMGVIGGYLVDGSIRARGKSTVDGADYDFRSDYKEAFHETNVMLGVGLGGSFRITPRFSLGMSIDYQEGLTKLTTSRLYDGVDVKSRSVGGNLFFGYRI